MSCHVDASESLADIELVIARSARALTAQQLSRIRTALIRWHDKGKSHRQFSITYSDATLAAVSRVLASLTHIFARNMDPGVAQTTRKRGKKLSKFAKKCLKTIVEFTQASPGVFGWRYPLQYAYSIQQPVGVPASEVLSSEWLGENFDTVRTGAIRSLVDSVRRGSVDEAQTMLSLLTGQEQFKEAATAELTRIFSEEVARLSIPTQEWLATSLQVQTSAPGIEYASPSESPEIRQAASLLLLLWDHASEGAAMKEALERFRVLCEKHFRLFVRGEVGMVMRFDHRIHEANAPVRDRVRILRPWVEWLNPPKAFVVIRALVAPND